MHTDRAHDEKYTQVPYRLYSINRKPSIPTLHDVCSRAISAGDYPLCKSVSSNILIYSTAHQDLTSPPVVSSLQDEWHHILLSGPAVFILEEMYTCRGKNIIALINKVFDPIVKSEKLSSKSNHLASSGHNARNWSLLGKHCEADPTSFSEYDSNPWLALVCDAWLGPAYRITAQISVVKAGGR
ncbi:hypothetical protein MMC28_005841 [Mycoblastus sanguinarius]|nr:hypothetical protein [Mycoblastus sanguinarius]